MSTASGDALGKQKHGVRHLARQAGARRQATRSASRSMPVTDALDERLLLGRAGGEVDVVGRV
jgi:hypothetical protein